MKIVQALKTIKANRMKIDDLIRKIRDNAARTSIQTSPYGDQETVIKQVASWMDTVRSVIRENEILTNRLHRTNALTSVTMEIGNKSITKTIDEWIVRRKEGVSFETRMMQSLTDLGLREELVKQPDGSTIHVTIVRHFDPKQRDDRMSVLMDEVQIIDSTLEIVNATTDLVD